MTWRTMSAGPCGVGTGLGVTAAAAFVTAAGGGGGFGGAALNAVRSGGNGGKGVGVKADSSGTEGAAGTTLGRPRIALAAAAAAAAVVGAVDTRGRTPLHHAARGGHTACCEALVNTWHAALEEPEGTHFFASAGDGADGAGSWRGRALNTLPATSQAAIQLKQRGSNCVSMTWWEKGLAAVARHAIGYQSIQVTRVQYACG